MAMFNQLVNSVSASQIDAQKFVRAQTLLQLFILGSLLSNNYQSTFNQLKLQMFEHNGRIHTVMKQKEYQFPIECIASQDVNLYFLINFHIQKQTAQFEWEWRFHFLQNH
jgi:hypothetical protein